MTTSINKNVSLRFVGVVKVMRKERSSADRRIRIDKTVVEYRDTNNIEYRGVFETRPGVKPVIPDTVMSYVLPSHRKQW